MIRVLTMLLGMLLLPTGQAEAAARAFLDRSSITLGETVTLNIELDVMGGVQPDLAPLATNFRLLGTSSSSQLQLVNGRQTASQLWAVALEPLTEGVIGIPALTVGADTTEPLTLTVLPAPQGATGGAGDDVFLEVVAVPLDPYVQQQVSYVVRLHYAVNLAEGQLEEPQAEGARMQRLGGDTRYQKNVGNRRYEVIERRYALVAERSGQLQVSPPRFRGAATDGGRGGFFSGGRRLQANGDSVTLNVRPQAPGAAQPWLPAPALTLTDESGALDGELRVGEPITLSLRLAVRGLAADQLPELSLPAIEGAQVYPDLESSQTGDSGEWLIGERVRRFAVVPSRVGPLEIPAVTIEWWNTDTDRKEQAQVAVRRLIILPPVGASETGVVPGVTGVPIASDAVSAAAVALPGTDTVWRWVSLAFAALWLATLALLLRRQRPRLTVTAATPLGADDTATRGALRQALEIGDLAAVARHLRTLAPAGGGIGLDRLAERLDDAAQAEAARALDRWLYAGAEPSARGSMLAQSRAAFRRPLRWVQSKSDAAPSKVGLPSLYR